MAGKREEQLKEITERLEQGVKDYFIDENYAAYLNTMAKFHDYSFNNTLLIAMQKPEATLVAGYHAWQKKFKRNVKKGERGIKIIAPAPVREKEEVEKIDPVTLEPVLKANGQPETEIIETVIPRFRVTTVFDVAQTEGEPLPELEMADLTAGVENYKEFMEAITLASPVPVRFAEIEGESHGYYHQIDKEIVIKEGMSESQTMKTAIHEVAHAKLHDKELLKEQGIRKDKLTREVEAESTAYVVCQYFNLDTSDYSFPYIAGWSSDRDIRELRTSMDTIRKTAGELIETIGEHMRELQKEHLKVIRIEPDEVVLKITENKGKDDTYHIVKNKGKEELKQLLEQYQESFEPGVSVTLEEYLNVEGVDTIILYHSLGFEEHYPVTFYDVEYDYDTGIHDVMDLPAMGFAAMQIDRAEYGRTIFNDSERNLIVNYAFKLDDNRAAGQLVTDLQDALLSQDMQVAAHVKTAAQTRIDAFPDGMVGFSEMHQYGYSDDGILPVGLERAHELFEEGYEIFALYSDNTEAELDDEGELDTHDGLFGIEKSVWEKHLEKTEEMKKEIFQEIELFGVPALFSNGRIEDSALPKGVLRYDLRGADYDPGNPLTIEKNVFVNHAASVMTMAELPMPENGKLWIGDEINFTGGELTISQYLQETKYFSMEEKSGVIENAIGRANEELLLEGNTDWYALYQLKQNGASRDKLFVGMDSLRKQNQSVDGAEYNLVYSGRLSPEDSLDSIYEKFNIDRPADFFGHSLSVSDVIVTLKDGKAEAHFVDSFGFTELSDFVSQRLHEAKMVRKRESAAVTLDTSGLEVEQHEGLWHTVDVREIKDELFYLMKHNEYGDSVAAVIVNADGELVAQDLENGFDKGAMEAIKEYLEEKGIEWQMDIPEESEIKTEQKAEIIEEKHYLPVYPHTLAHAMEDGAVDEYLDSRKLNMDCKRGIEKAIADNFDGMHLKEESIKPVIEEFGQERVAFILANTIQELSYDGRFSRERKMWAESISIEENISHGMNMNQDYVLSSHPAVLDGFVGLFMEAVQKQEKQKESVVDEIGTLDEEQQAYRTEKGYFVIQTATEGYDYTLYDENYRDLDGGIYDNPEVTMEEARKDILMSENISPDSCEKISYDELMEEVEKVEQAQIQEVQQKQPEQKLTSGEKQTETALNGLCRDEIEETVLCMAQAEIDEQGLSGEIELLGARVFGSRTREGLYREDSDIDVVLSYSGNIREDAFFNALKETDFRMAGILVDINPISLEKTGTLASYLENAEKYLDSKEVEVLKTHDELKTSEPEEEVQEPEVKLSFFFAECREFPILGEFHEDITLEEAVQYYNQIPAERIHGIKSIGFKLEDGTIYDGTYDLFCGGEILYDELDLVPHYRDSQLVQKAIGDLEQMIENGKLNAKPIVRPALASETEQKKIVEEAEQEDVSAEPERETTKDKSQTSQTKKSGSRESVLKALRERQAKLKEQEKPNGHNNTKEHKKGDISL